GRSADGRARTRRVAGPPRARPRQRLHPARRRRAGDAARHGAEVVGAQGPRRAGVDRVRHRRRDPAAADARPPRPRRWRRARRRGDRARRRRPHRRRVVRQGRAVGTAGLLCRARPPALPDLAPADLRRRARRGGAHRRAGAPGGRRPPRRAHARALPRPRVVPARGDAHPDHRRLDLQRAGPAVAGEVALHRLPPDQADRPPPRRPGVRRRRLHPRAGDPGCAAGAHPEVPGEAPCV
ncbi:MAG: MBL-fold metallo-hydrolase superfamily, partial [uncultured Nocardioides sp.]